MDTDNSDIEHIFEALGLGRADTLTYLALLQQGSVSIRKLALATGINRGTTYEALKRLTAIGLVHMRHEADRERFAAEDPEKLLTIIRDKKRDLVELDAAAKNIVPRLLAARSDISQPLVKYYEGDAGVVTILRDVLQTCRQLPKREYYAYSSSPIRQYLYRRFPLFTAQRIAAGIVVKVIAVGEGGEVTELSERKWLHSPDSSVASSYTIIYGNKVATISIAANDTPYGVVIEDNGAASLQRLLFEQLWSYL